MPVLFAGFAWSLWLHGPANAIPRLGGRFFWEQAKAAARIHTTALYIAMFDEYDESTAIMKAAEDSSQIPQGKYFLTTCADGDFVSSDFYLRLVGKLTEIYRNQQPLPDSVPVPLSEGPVYLRTGFEAMTDAAPSIKMLRGEADDCDVRVETTAKAHRGDAALHVRMASQTTLTNLLIGIFNTGSYTISSTMTLRAYMRPENDGGQCVLWDVQTEEGTWLSDTEGYRLDNVDKSFAGGAIGEWNRVMIPVGRYLEGKTIRTIALRYPGGALDADVYIDDVLLYE